MGEEGGSMSSVIVFPSTSIPSTAIMFSRSCHGVFMLSQIWPWLLLYSLVVFAGAGFLGSWAFSVALGWGYLIGTIFLHCLGTIFLGFLREFADSGPWGVLGAGFVLGL